MWYGLRRGSEGGACGSGEVGVVGKFPVKTGGGGIRELILFATGAGGRSVWIESCDG